MTERSGDDDKVSKGGLCAEHLKKTYRGRTVVRDVSLSVSAGSIVGLLGPNGAGKTTSFYMIVGLIAPEAGRVTLDGQDITAMPIHSRARVGLGYLPQENSIFRKLSVRDNLLGVLELNPRLSRTERRQRVDELLEEFSITALINSTGMSLSGGERRRVEIARALAADPKFILLDEPFAGVDPIAVEDIQYIVWKLKDLGLGILITDHNVEQTLSITDRAYLLFEGRILFHGTPEELSSNQIVRDKYLTQSFVLRKKDFSKVQQPVDN